MEPTGRRKTSPRHCEPTASPNLSTSLRAKRSNPALAPKKESWIASSQGLLAMTWRGRGFNFKLHLICHLQTNSRDLAAQPREFCKNFPPSQFRGRRECRAPDAPD